MLKRYLVPPSKKAFLEIMELGLVSPEEIPGWYGRFPTKLNEAMTQGEILNSMGSYVKRPGDGSFDYAKIKSSWDSNIGRGMASTTDLRLTPESNMRTLIIRSSYTSTSEGAVKEYNTGIRFRDVFSAVFSRLKTSTTAKHHITVDLLDVKSFTKNLNKFAARFGYPLNIFDCVEAGDKAYVYQVPTTDRTKMKVGCTCPFYRYYLSYANVVNDVSMTGRFPRYTRKSLRPRKNRRNPKNIPGECKHIYFLVNLLVESGLVREVSGGTREASSDIAKKIYNGYISSLINAALKKRKIDIEKAEEVVEITDEIDKEAPVQQYRYSHRSQSVPVDKATELKIIGEEPETRKKPTKANTAKKPTNPAKKEAEPKKNSAVVRRVRGRTDNYVPAEYGEESTSGVDNADVNTRGINPRRKRTPKGGNGAGSRVGGVSQANTANNGKIKVVVNKREKQKKPEEPGTVNNQKEQEKPEESGTVSNWTFDPKAALRNWRAKKAGEGTASNSSDYALIYGLNKVDPIEEYSYDDDRYNNERAKLSYYEDILYRGGRELSELIDAFKKRHINFKYLQRLLPSEIVRFVMINDGSKVVDNSFGETFVNLSKKIKELT